jgi:hypothetical protein
VDKEIICIYMHTIAYYAAINKNGMMSLSEKTGDPHAK